MSEVDPLIGRTIGGKFVIERLLGAGAMGAVYRAHQTALERTVAIKVMHGALASDPTYAARFHREAKAVSRLDHPNLIRVLDYGQETDGLLYIAMEFLDGRDLFSVIEQEWPLPHDRIVDILSQVLSALGEAHDAGVLHRDLKPENIMLLRRKAEDGTAIDVVKVCDFGIAKIVEGAEAKPETPASGGGRKLTSAGLVVGTPGYMSPEQARSEVCDARSDLYSVGVILYQLLSRRLPFEGNTPLDVVVKALFEPPPPLGSFGPTAAPGLEPMCVRAMNKKREDRYQTARELRSALRAAPVIARQVIISAGDRPSMVNAPTQAELVTSAASTGVGTTPNPTRRTPPLERAAGVTVALAIAGAIAFVELRPGHPSPPALLAASPTAAITVEPPRPSTAPEARTLSPPPPSSNPVTPTETAPSSAPPSPPRPPNRRAMHDTQEILAFAPETPQPSAPPPPVAPTPPPTPVVVAVPSSSTPPSVTAPAVAVAPTSPPPPATPAPPTFNLATARVEIGQARTNNAAATGGAVSRAIGPFTARFTGCYRAALAQATTASEAPATLHLESDDQGYVTTARVKGAIPDGAARCIEGLVTRNLKIEVDTGTANADVSLTFKPL